jgi:valyl-tRNA synthetase
VTERIITAPLGVQAGLGFAELATIVGADALARHRAVTADNVILPTLVGDHGGFLALERSGRQPADFEAARVQAVLDALTLLGVDATLDDAPDANTADPRILHPAIVAFVRLYEEGIIDQIDAVVAVCPSCATVIEGPDAVAGSVEADVLHVVFDADTDFVVRIVAPELIEGAVAVAVPLGDVRVGTEIVLPLVGRRVPVIAEIGRSEAGLVVPAHDADALELARAHGLPPIHVFDEHGTRYAARQAARELLEAEGVVREVTPGEEAVERCRHCRSIAVHLLGPHWMLRGASLEVGAADVVRDGLVSFVPSDARDAFLSTTTTARAWCLDRRLPGGVPLPVATCEECGRASIDVTPSARCGKCLGILRRDPGATLDARFVAALWPLAMAGWPAPLRFRRAESAEKPSITAVVPPDQLACWLLPALAFAQHFTGDVPFGAVVVQPPSQAGDDIDIDALLARATEGDTAHAEGPGRTAVRLTLLSGDPNVTIEPGVADDAHAAAAVDDARRALDEAGPAQAAALFIAALNSGLSTSARARAAPFLGAGFTS